MTIELFECSCHAEGITLDELDGEIYISMWEQGYRHKGLASRTFKERLKYAWKIIKSGTLHTDQIMMNPEEAHQLGVALLDLSHDFVYDLTKNLEEFYDDICEEYGE